MKTTPHCHSERSEESLTIAFRARMGKWMEMFRSAQHDSF
jgi:hypothetical protein